MLEMYMETSDRFFYAWVHYSMQCTKLWGHWFEDIEDAHGMWLGGGEL